MLPSGRELEAALKVGAISYLSSSLRDAMTPSESRYAVTASGISQDWCSQGHQSPIRYLR